MTHHRAELRDVHFDGVTACAGFPIDATLSVIGKLDDLLRRQSRDQVTLESIVQTLKDVVFVRLRFDRTAGLGTRLAIFLDQHPDRDCLRFDGVTPFVDRGLLFACPCLGRALRFDVFAILCPLRRI